MGDQTAVGLHITNDLIGDSAGVEIVNPVLSDASQSVRHIGVAQNFPRAPQGAVLLEVDLAAAFRALKLLDLGDAAGALFDLPEITHVGAHHETAFRIVDRRLQKRREVHGSEAFQRFIIGAKAHGRGDRTITHLINPAFEDEAKPILGLMFDEVRPHIRGYR